VATASVSQVHRARRADDASLVAVKVQLPEVANTLAADLDILEYLAELLEERAPSVRPFKPVEVVRELRLPHPQSETGSLTISIGCATSNETDISAESLLALVDSRLYLAKQGGRNRLVCSDDAAEGDPPRKRRPDVIK